MRERERERTKKIISRHFRLSLGKETFWGKNVFHSFLNTGKIFTITTLEVALSVEVMVV